MHVSLRAALACWLACIGHAAVPDCAVDGRGYTDALVSTPNGGAQVDASACQQACKASPTCFFFTYYNNSKLCWLLGEHATLMVVPDTPGTSGPKECSKTGGADAQVVAGSTQDALDGVKESAQKALEKLALDTAGAQAAHNSSEQITKATETETTSVPAVAASGFLKREDDSSESLMAAGSGGQLGSSSGSVPWWALLGSGLVAAGAAAGGAYYCNEQQKKSEEKKKKKASRAVALENTAEQAPLIASVAASPLPAMAPRTVMPRVITPMVQAVPQQFAYQPGQPYPLVVTQAPQVVVAPQAAVQ